MSAPPDPVARLRGQTFSRLADATLVVASGGSHEADAGSPAPSTDATDAGDTSETTERRRVIAALYEEHYRSLVRLACLLVDHTEAAEEIVQEAFVRLHGSLDQVREPDARPAYLRSIVMNLARARLRRRLVQMKHAVAGERSVTGADVGAVVRENQMEVIRALRTLPTRQRECLVLRYYGECTEVEIAAALGISQGTVKSHMSRAMRAMQKQLEGQQ